MEKDLIPVKYVIVDNIIFYSRDTKISKNTINTGKDFEQTNNSSIYINPSLFYNNKVVYIYEWNQVIVETINNTFSESDFAEVGEYFKEDFGVLCFKDCIGPNTFLNINLFILSRKIEYNDFLLMIDYLNNKISNIAFSFNANTKINTRRSLSKRSEFDYYIFLYLLNIYDTRNVSNVFKFINVILNSPHKTMIKEYKKINSLFLETFDPDIIGEIASNPTNLITVNNTNLISSAIGNSSNNYFPRGIIIQNNRETFDTQENIFIKYFLTHSKFIMNQFLQKNTSPYKIKLVKKANDIIKKIDFIISTTYFKQVRTLDYLPYNSSVLKNKYGYKQIFDYYLKLSKAPITLLENEIIDELMDGKLLSTLYEYFCYFRIIDLIIDIYKCNPIITSNKIIIERKSAKSKFKGIYASEGKEQVMIKLSAISNIIFDVDFLILCGLGLPVPSDFRDYNKPDIKQYPNCIVGTYDELKPIYDYLLSLT